MVTIQNIIEIIYTLRDVQVMIDADLAVTYGYSTKTFNQ